MNLHNPNSATEFKNILKESTAKARRIFDKLQSIGFVSLKGSSPGFE